MQVRQVDDLTDVVLAGGGGEGDRVIVRSRSCMRLAIIVDSKWTAKNCACECSERFTASNIIASATVVGGCWPWRIIIRVSIKGDCDVALCGASNDLGDASAEAK